MARYVAIVEDEGPDKAVGIWFPDLPGCFSGGDDLDEALQNASDAIGLYRASLAKEGRPLPSPRLLGDLRNDPAVAEDMNEHLVLLIDAPETDSKDAAVAAKKDNRKLGSLRNLVMQQIFEVGRTGGFQTEAVIAAVRKNHPEAINQVQTELETLALRRLVNQLASRKMAPDDVGIQRDLSENYGGIPIAIPISSERPETRKLFTNATLKEVRTWLAEQDPSGVSRQKYSGVLALMRDLSSLSLNDNATIEEAVTANALAKRRA
jgi:predicted RNase H-like HicB family nuclease